MEIKDKGHTTTIPDTTPVMAYEDWLKEGKRRFGENLEKWKFKCSICAHVATVEDYKPYKDKGATPNSAIQECIGRYQGATSFAMKGQGPCNYALYGLFRFPGVIVKDDSGKDTMAFAFADEET